MQRIHVLSLMILSLLVTATAWAGVVVTEDDGSKTFFQQGKMKSVDAEGQPDMIMDYDGGHLTIVDNEQNTYIRTTVKEWCSNIQAAQKAMVEQIPPEVRQQMEAAMKAQQGNYSVEKKGNEDVSGYKSTKYVVLKDGQVEDTFWVTMDPKIMKEIGDWDKFVGMMDEFSSCMTSPFGGQESQLMKSYSKIYQKGFPIKNVEAGEETAGDGTLSIDFRDLSGNTFDPPEGYREVSIEQAFEME